MERIYAVGDIHGRYDKLVELLDRIDVDFNSDRLVFLGDYVDRGEQSYEVIEHLVTLKKQHPYPQTIFLKGNHEDMMEKYLAGKDRLTWLINGGQQTLESYMQHHRNPEEPLIPESHRRFFESLQLYHESEDYIFVHAGLRKGVPLEKQKPEDLMWIRKKFIDTDFDFGKPVVFGHTPLQEPLLQPNKIGIDTGAVYGNKLTCVRLPEQVFYNA